MDSMTDDEREEEKGGGKERKERKRLAPEGAKVGPGWRGSPPLTETKLSARRSYNPLGLAW